MPISSLYSSILIVVRWADLVSGFFGTYNGTLRQSGSGDSSIFAGIFCTNLAFQDRTPSPLPSPVLFFSCRLEASARGRWHPSIHPPLKLPTASTHGPVPLSSGVPLYIRLSNSRQHPPTDRCHLPLASLYTSAPQTPDSIHPQTDASFVPLYIHLTNPQALPGPAP